ncbi:iron transporter [Ottowia thiooxydans]|uniref:Iron transporter n=1 Tax=Ottowia thiooxydans TaxID=219182 RepID=A0ABV2Q398_9BURK
MSKPSTPTAAYRWSVASRVAAAALGGYALSSVATVLLGLVWPAPKAQAVLWATMLSFVVYTVAVIWAFYTRSASRAWMGMALGTAVCTALSWWLIRGAGV